MTYMTCAHEHMSTPAHMHAYASPLTRGAVKRTTLPGKWAHVACAYWLNDVGFLNPTTLEPICSIIDGQKGCISSVLPGTPENQRYLSHLERWMGWSCAG